MPILRTERLILRPIAESDVDALHRVWTDPDVRRYLWDDVIISKETVAEIVHASEACFRDVGSGYFALELADQPGVLVGFCGHRRFEDGDQMELLYAILPDYWGQGLTTEAAAAVLQYGFEECGMERVVASTDTPNQRSVRVLQHLGMVFEQRREYRGLDTIFYSITPQDLAARL